MSFTSFRFVLFFGIIYFLNWIYLGIQKVCKCENKKTYRVILLLESYLFIVIVDWKTAISLFLLTVVSYVVAESIEKYRDHNARAKLFLISGLVIAIGQLSGFKYYDFVAENACKLLDLQYITVSSYVPLGISFFTFSAISYMLDVYRKKYDRYDRLIDVSLYLAFFPKLLSGPIIRPNIFMEQIRDGSQNLNLKNLQIGIQYVVWGFFKKMVIADHLAVFVDNVFGVPKAFNAVTCVWAMISYSFQIYFDFSGYSDIAIGFSRMLGIEIDKNFDLPYISKNVTEFWKRWHISLSSWLQEYLYISLGGNRKGKMRTKINLFLTMLLGGLWHGANWTFIVWGAIHGIALIIQKEFKRSVNACKKTFSGKKRIWEICSGCLTFVFVTITWVFFRASSLKNAFEMFQQVITLKAGIMQLYTWTWFAIVFVIMEVVYAYSIQKREHTRYVSIRYPLWDLNTVKGLTMFFMLAGLTIILAYVGDTAFIYGKF